MLTIDKVIYNDPATIILWNDGTKTTAICDDNDTYSKEVGFMLCVLKKKYGNKTVQRMFEKYVYAVPSTNNEKRGCVISNKDNSKVRVNIKRGKPIKNWHTTYPKYDCFTLYGKEAEDWWEEFSKEFFNFL